MSAESRRRRRPKPLRRSAGIRPVRATFRVYAEGIATEPDYIDALKRIEPFRESLSIEIQVEEAGMQPMTLVERARDDKRAASSEIDHYWCVFDVESPQNNPHLPRALQMARDNGIHLAISNPCFELWLILHFQDQTGYLSTDAAASLRRSLDGSAGKGVDGSLYMPGLEQAMYRAWQLRKKHIEDGTSFPDDNPSSSFDLFVRQAHEEVRDRTVAMAEDQEDGEGGD